jgi:hypothetical protein
MAIEFVEFPKIPRLKREIAVTEKIDGTNACVVIDAEGNMGAQSRNRVITPENDNYGFAAWVRDNTEELKKLGEGHHYGEWFGPGIGPRKYPITERRFALFNVARWNDQNPNKPACCHVVPQIVPWGDWQGVDQALEILRTQGSVAVPGFMRPEGIIVYHSASRGYFKVLLENDDTPKSNLKETA